MVVPKRLFVNVPEQVERLNAHIRALQAPFEQAPEVLASVRVNLAVHVRFGVVNDLVRQDVFRALYVGMCLFKYYLFMLG
jgi:putative heme degradation protein